MVHLSRNLLSAKFTDVRDVSAPCPMRCSCKICRPPFRYSRRVLHQIALWIGRLTQGTQTLAFISPGRRLLPSRHWSLPTHPHSNQRHHCQASCRQDSHNRMHMLSLLCDSQHISEGSDTATNCFRVAIDRRWKPSQRRPHKPTRKGPLYLSDQQSTAIEAMHARKASGLWHNQKNSTFTTLSSGRGNHDAPKSSCAVLGMRKFSSRL